GTSVPEQRRAAQGAAAKQRGDRTRLANQRELERSPLGVLDATVTTFGAASATEATRRGFAYRQAVTTPEYRALKAPFDVLEGEIAADRRALRAATRGSTEAFRLQARLDAYDRLKLGQTKNPNATTISEAEMGRLDTEARAGRGPFSVAEV